MTIPLSLPAYDEKVHSDEDLIREVKNYSNGVKEVVKFNLSSTSDTTPSTSGRHYTCEDWVSQISIGKLKSIAHKYKLGGDSSMD